MKFVVDECTGPGVARWLREIGYEVFSVFEESRGLDDYSILEMCNEKDYILITNDRDFGEMVFRHNLQHHGVIYLRLSDNRPASSISVLEKVFKNYTDDIKDNFLTVTEKTIRIVRPGREK
jgi:predicted nuclease of predicted toxin-antitoxin system